MPNNQRETDPPTHDIQCVCLKNPPLKCDSKGQKCLFPHFVKIKFHCLVLKKKANAHTYTKDLEWLESPASKAGWHHYPFSLSPGSLFDMVLTRGGGLGTWVPLVVNPLRWFFCLLGRGSFHFVPCIHSPFFGCFGFFFIGSVSSSSCLKWPSLFGCLGLKRRNLIILFTPIVLVLA